MRHFTNGDLDSVDTGSKFQRRAPTVLVVLVFVAIVVGLFAGVKVLTAKPEPVAVATPKPLPIEEYTPVEVELSPELDQYGNPIPQRVEVEIGVYPSSDEVGCTTKSLPRSNPFCDNLSDRALTDRHVANYMAGMAAHHIAPGSPGSLVMTKDATHWLRQVVQTPVEDGGPALQREAEFVEILDRWMDDDLSTVTSDYEFLKEILGW